MEMCQTNTHNFFNNGGRILACFEAILQPSWIHNFITILDFLLNVQRPLKIYCDNSGAISFSHDTGTSLRFKHINVKYLFIK